MMRPAALTFRENAYGLAAAAPRGPFAPGLMHVPLDTRGRDADGRSVAFRAGHGFVVVVQ